MDQMAEADHLRDENAALSERLMLCDVPDGWEAWRLKSEAKVEELTRERDTLRKHGDLALENSVRAEKAQARLAKVAGAVAQWQGADSLPDCTACSVLDAALAAVRGEEG